MPAWRWSGRHGYGGPAGIVEAGLLEAERALVGRTHPMKAPLAVQAAVPGAGVTRLGQRAGGIRERHLGGVRCFLVDAEDGGVLPDRRFGRRSGVAGKCDHHQAEGQDAAGAAMQDGQGYGLGPV